MARATSLSVEDFFGHRITYDDLAAEMQADVKSDQSFIPLDICALRVIDTNNIDNLVGHGGIVALDSDPLLKRVNGATDKALRIEWAANSVIEAQFPPVPWPPDLDPDEDVVVHLLLSRNTGTDDCTIDVQAYEGTVTGSAYAADTEMGGATAAIAVNNIIVERTVVLGSSDIVGAPGFLNLSLVPAAHTTDKIWLWAAWIEYSRKLRTT